MYLLPKRQRLELDELEESSSSITYSRNQFQNLDPEQCIRKYNLDSSRVSDMSQAEISMPYFGIQCDWEDNLSRIGGSVWVSVRRPGSEKSVHGDLKCMSASPLQVESREPFTVANENTTKNFLCVKDDVSQYECGFVAPIGIFKDIHKKSVISMDVTEGGLGVSLCQNNELKIWETESGKVRRTLEGHVVDAYSCRFFPSGVVVLTAGADLQIKIWSAETGECPVTFKGHTAAVQDTCIVDRGRNIISVSKDGTARLWDCGESKNLATLLSCGAEINSCCLVAPSSVDLGPPVPNMSEREIGTMGKLLLVAREDGKVQGVSVACRSEIFTAPLPSAANRVIATGPNSFVVGCQTGEIATFDLRKVVPPKKIHSATHTPILDLMIHPRSPSSKPGTDESNRLFWASKSDGTCVLINPNLNEPSKKLIQLTGSDFDPIYQMKHDGNYIYTACRDGVIRKYSIDHVTKLVQQ